MSKSSFDSKTERKSSYFKRGAYLTQDTVRRELVEDLNGLLNLVNDQTTQLFGEIDCKKILNTCYIQRCIQNEHNQTVGVICLNDYPNVPSIPSYDWNCWMANIYGLEITTPRNTAWIHLVLYDNQYTYDFLKPLLQSIFLDYFFLDYIVMVIPPGATGLDFLEGYGTRIVPPGFYDANKVQTLYLLVRQHFVTKYKIRRAVEEDNDDLVPLIHKYSQRLQEFYGEFYVAEIVKHHANSGRHLIVAEYEDAAVSVLFLNDAVNHVVLYNEFELVPFYGLRKPHPNDELKSARKTSSIHLIEESHMEEVLSNLSPRKSLQDIQLSLANATSNEHVASGPKYVEDEISLLNVSSVHMSMKSPSEFFSVHSSESKTYSAMILSMNDYEMHLFENRTATNKIDDSDVRVFQNLTASDYNEYLPLLVGELNAFTLELAVSQPEHDVESMRLLLEAAFECFPERDYCVLTFPSTTNHISIFHHFVRCIPRPVSKYPQELYVVHRNSILGNITVRPAIISDIGEVQALIDNIQMTHTLIDNFLAAVCEEYDYEAYVILTNDKVVGVAIVKEEVKYDYMKTHYRLFELIDDRNYTNSSCGRLLHLILSPIFHSHSRFFLKEILRLSDYSILTYCICAPDTIGTTRTRPICSVIGAMFWVRPRRMPEFTQTNLEDSSPEPVVTEELDPFALYVITKHLCTLQYHRISTKIVVVGSGNTALAFVDALIGGRSKSYQVNFLNVTLLAPHGLNYERRYNKVQKMLFVRTTDFNYKQMQMIAMRTYINVINGVMTKIDRRNKMIIINDNSFLAYDLLFIMCGEQYQKPQLSKDKKLKDFPENVFLINTEVDATHALKKLKHLINEVPNRQYTILVYGHVLEAFCCIRALLEYGVPGTSITFVESCPSQYEPPNGNYSQPFPDSNVDFAVSASIARQGVIHHKSFYFVEWFLEEDVNKITSVKFESSYRRLVIDCIAMFMYNEKTVSPRTFSALQSAGLVFDGALVINSKCKTNDPFIYAAGTITKYSRRYYADHLSHKYFNLKEIGFKLGQRICNKLIPACDEQLPEDTLTCPKNTKLVPHYTKPLIKFCYLPGNLQYLSVTKPGRAIPIAIAVNADDYGQVLTTGDCRNLDRNGYFTLHLNKHGVVETITCLSQFKIDRNNIMSLWGKSEKLLNNLRNRFELSLISDLYEYFREPWTCAIYNDSFADLDNSILNFMTSRTAVEGNSPLEDLIRMYKENDWKELNVEQKEELNGKFSSSPYHDIIEKKVLDFLEENRIFFPMYAHPFIVRQLLKDCDLSPLFNEQ